MARRARPAQAELFAAPRYAVLCGVDEAGRGPLAGAVFAAAVILDPKRPVRGLKDSKQLSAAQRETLAGRIQERAIAWCVARASVEEIDTLNILHASLLAMRRAVEGLAVVPQCALVDGNVPPRLSIPVQTVVQGDVTVKAISAASILAKTARDAYMAELHEQYPMYGFARHMGYATAEHLDRLRHHGACPHHRRSFAPVRDVLAPRAEPAPDAAPGLPSL